MCCVPHMRAFFIKNNYTLASPWFLLSKPQQTGALSPTLSHFTKCGVLSQHAQVKLCNSSLHDSRVGFNLLSNTSVLLLSRRFSTFSLLKIGEGGWGEAVLDSGQWLWSGCRSCLLLLVLLLRARWPFPSLRASSYTRMAASPEPRYNKP